MASYPKKKEEVEAFLRKKSPEEQLCLQYLYAFMTVNDIVSYEVEWIARYVEASLSMRKEVAYASQVPEELFLTYVLQYRVNNEHVDASRQTLYEILLPRIREKGMRDAALEVNYWCYERATYIPSDDRTLAPSAIMKKAKGRCGEESTFTVSAMRSVGIPARQCYSPRWAHCDDNHAWVEIWVDGAWHYLGACEPEPVLDKGWFTAAASKAMLVHAKAHATLESGLVASEEAAYSTPVYTLLNSTPTYGETRTFVVQILEHGIPQEQVRVQFQLVNYSELYPIYESRTDKEGKVRFVTGMGDLCIYVEKEGKILLKKADMRREETMTLDLKDAVSVEELEGRTDDFDLVPPTEHVAAVQREADWEAHEKRLAICDTLREQVEAGFAVEEGDAPSHYRALAKGNREEIDAFFSWEGAGREEKLAVLSTLREKDLVDITCETLQDYVIGSRPYEGRYPREDYISYILAPRISNEMIVPARSGIQSWLKERHIAFETGRQVWEYLKKQISIMPDYGAAVEAANSFKALAYGMCDAASFPIVFVSVCRSAGIPARLNPVTKEPEYGIKKNEAVVFVPLKETDGGEKNSSAKNQTFGSTGREDGEDTKTDILQKDDEKAGISQEAGEKQTVRLTLVNEEKRTAVYSIQFSLGVWKEDAYRTLDLYGVEVRGEETLSLEPGQYRLLTSVRQIDGSVSARLHYFSLYQDKTVALSMREDKTKEKIKRVPLSDVTVKQGDGTEKLSRLWKKYPGLLIVADPGKEPTEHLLQEILECREQYREKGVGIAILLKEKSRNETLQKVIKELPDTKIFEWEEEKEIYRLHVDMQVGDERLPFAVALDKEGRGLFAFANYNIRTAQTMYHILEVAEQE